MPMLMEARLAMENSMREKYTFEGLEPALDSKGWFHYVIREPITGNKIKSGEIYSNKDLAKIDGENAARWMNDFQCFDM